jgi:hypothetical protein
MKICSACKQPKELSEFYRDKYRASGFMCRCKICDRLHYRKSREKHKETYNEKDRRYYKKNKVKILEKRRLWREKNEFKISAHLKVKSALRKGELVRLPCEVCGNEKTKAHHDDYTKPLDVR